MTAPAEPVSQPNRAVLDRTLVHLTAAADKDSTSYWLAWVDGAFIAADTRYPRHALTLRNGALVSTPTRQDIRAHAKWYVGPHGVVLPLGEESRTRRPSAA